MNSTIDELEAVYFEKHELETRIKELDVIEKDLRKIVMSKMQEEGLKSQVSPSGRLKLTTSTTRDVQIADEPTVRVYLQSNGLLDECTKLDTMKVKKLAKEHEDMPGMEPVERTTITLREVKDSVEQLQPDESNSDFRARIRATQTDQL